MIPTSRLAAIILAIFSLPLALHATDPTLDSAFVSTISPGITPDGYPTFDTGTGAVNAVALQSDGKIIAGGNISRYQAPPAGSPQSSLKRLNSDGTLDTAFGTIASTLADSQGQTEVNKILTVAGDKLYVGGVFTSYDGVACGGVLRLNSGGSLDTGFNAAGISNSNAFGIRYVLALAEQPDGKLLVGGGFNRANGTYRPNLARFNDDGTLDPSFNPNSVLGDSSFVGDLAILPDGDILVAGGRNRPGGGGTPLLVRLNSDGSLDPSLAPSFTNDFGDIDELLVLPDGRILIGGDFSFAPTGTSYNFAALLPDGSLDTAFMTNVGSGPNGWAGGELTLQPDGTILVGGIFKRWNNQVRASVARLNPDGTLDAGFAVPPYIDDNSYLTHLYSFAVQPDGKLVAGGWFNRISDSAVETYNLTRFVNEYAPGQPGTLRFAATQVTTAENAGSVTLQVSRFGGLTGAVSVNFGTLSGGADGTATTGDDFSTATGTLSWADGEGGFKTLTVPVLQDTTIEQSETFTVALSGVTGGAFLPAPASRATVTLRDDDSLPVVTSQPASVSLEQGSAFSLSIRYDSVLAATVQWQRDPDGDGPLTFTNIPGATSTIYTVATADLATHAGVYQAIVNNPNGSTSSNSAAVSISVPAGSLVTSFAPPSTTPIVLSAQGMSVDTSGRYLMLSSTALRRLNTDGTLDPTTSFGISVSGATCVLGLDDGKILVAGNLSIPYTHQPSGATSTVNTRIFRLNSDATGTIDTSWSVSTNGIVTALAPGASGKFYVGSGAAPTSTNGIQRFLANGATDASWTPAVNTIAAGTGATVVFIKELADAKILVSHRHGSTSTGTYRLSRLTSTGALDTTFGTGGSIDFGTSNWVNGLDVLPDGRIAVSGRFNTDFFTAGQRYLAILNTNGTLDTSFQFGSTVLNGNPNGVIYRDGRLFVWGAFTTVNGTPQGGVMRVNLDGSIDSSFSAGAGIAGGAASVNAARFTSGGEIFITGGFTSYKGVARNYSALLVGNPQIGAIGFAPPRASVVEGNQNLTLTLRRYGAFTEAASIAWATADGTAISGADYTAAFGTATWAAGDSADRTITLTLFDDAAIESAETFRIVLSAPTGPVGIAASATVTLIDSDTPVAFTAQPAGSALVENGNLALSATVTSPSPVTYQWFRNGRPVSGGTSASLSKTGVTAADAGVYTLVATNAAGSFTSNPVVVNIRPQPGRLSGGQTATGRPGFAAISAIPTGLAALNDGGCLIGGNFAASPGNNINQAHLIRVRSDGSTETSFSLPLNGSADALLRQPDGKIVVAGAFTAITGSPLINATRILRLNTDLTVDTTFAANTGTALTANVADLALDSTGRIYAGLANGAIHRFSADGVRDNAYTPLANAGISALAVQTDDKLLVAGGFTNINTASPAKYKFARLLTDGTVDTAFTNAVGNSQIAGFNDLLTLPDGRILALGGNIGVVEVSSTGGLVTNVDGSTQPYRAIATPDGKILILRTGTGKLYRLTSALAPDATFSTGTGLEIDSRAIAASPDGSIWIAGPFTSYNGVNTQGVIKINGDPLNPAIVNPPAHTGVAPGATAHLGVGAYGIGLTYQWFKNGTPLGDTGNISGSTTAILTIANASATDDDDYTVAVTGGSPATTVTSGPAHLYLLGAPIVATPPAAVDVFAGPALSFSAEVFAAATATYQWSRNGVNLADDARISGATTATLGFSSTTAADTGNYLLTITNSQGTATTSVFVLVRPVPTGRAAVFSGLSSSQSVTALHALPDGGMLVANLGGTLTNNSVTTLTNRLQLVRADGTVANLGLDPANSGVALPGLGFFTITTIFRQPDGKILLGGNIGGLGATLIRILPDGNLDPAFTTLYGSNSTGSVIRTIVLDDAGRILIGGDFTNLGGISGQTLLARLDPVTGAIDTTFVSSFSSGSLTCILKLPGANSGFLIGGTNMANPFTVNIRRYDASGANIASYAGPNINVNTLALTPDGTAFYAAIQSTPYLARYRVSDGAIDTAFTVPTGTFNNQVHSLAVQSDGKVIAHGQFNIYPQTQIGRILTNGAPDPTFLVGGTNTNNTYYPLALDTAGRIWLGGSFTNFNNATANRIAVLEGDVPTLAWDTQPQPRSVAAGETIAFSASVRATSAVTYQWYKDGALLSDGGRVSGVTSAALAITGATVADEGLYSVRATSLTAGTIESASAELVFLAAPEIFRTPVGGTYNTGSALTLTVGARGAGTLSYQWFKGTATTPIADIPGATGAAYTLAVPATTDTAYYGVRVTNNLGSVSSTPVLVTVQRPAGGHASIALPTVSGALNVVLPLTDGRYIVGGGFSSVFPPGSVSQSRQRLARFNADGSLDTAFPATQSGGDIYAAVVDTPGATETYLVGGNFNTLGGQTRYFLGRINRDGTIPATNLFASPFNSSGVTIQCLALDSTGDIYVGGTFTTASLTGLPATRYLVRLSGNGTVEQIYDTTAASSAVYVVHPLAGGQILAGGDFGLRKLNSDGTVDATFVNNTTNVRSLSALADGFLVGRTNGFLRIGTAGALVNPFPATGSATTGSITELLALPSGKVVLGGSFTSYNSVTTGNIASVSTDGQLDSTINFGSGFGNSVNSLALDAQNRLWIAGSFTTYKGATTSRLVVLDAVTTTPTDPGSPVTSDPLADFLTNAGIPANLRGPNDDADNDGLDNLLEYALDLNPNGTGGAFSGSPTTFEQTPSQLSFTYRRVRNDVTYIVETSPTLIGGTWTSVGVTQGTPAGDGTTTASIPVSSGSQFLRLSVTR